MNKEITIEQNGVTQGTENPVYEVAGKDGHIQAIPSDEGLYVPMALCPGETKMGDLVTKTVEKTGITTVKFPSVLNQTLIDKLDGFEKTTEMNSAIGEPVEVWVGEWKVGME